MVPIRVSKKADVRLEIDLLLIDDETKFHYVLITNLPLLVSRITKRRLRPRDKLCRNCFYICSSPEVLERHCRTCLSREPAVVKMPSEKQKKVSFKNLKARWFAPIVLYFDLESLLQPLSSCDTERQSTKTIELHTPCSYCLVAVEHNNPKPLFVHLMRSEDCITRLVKELEQIAKEVHAKKQTHRYYRGSPPVRPENVDKCWICEEEFLDTEDDKVLDHCHYSGDFLGFAHSNCNLKRQTINFIPVVAHNLSNYDLHPLCRKLNEFDKNCKIQVIPSTDEKYISLSVGVPVRQYRDKNGQAKTVYEYLRFIDSFRFMNSSLDKLVSYLPSEKFQLLDNHYQALQDEQKQLLHTKGFYPYNYFDHHEKFLETELPPLECWKNSLKNDEIHITMDEWNKALHVFKSLKCKNLGEYHDLYLTTDTLLLACVVEEFRRVCYETYKLDSIQYLTCSHLSGDAFIRTCRADIELLTDREHLEMVENMIRGGVSSIFEKRFFKANNPYLESFDSTKEETYGVLMDANNLYGGIMEKFPLPLNDFQTILHFDLQQILATPNDSGVGYILEVDLHYPDNLHDNHRDFPLAPTKETIHYRDLSNWQLSIIERMTNNTDRQSPSKKLIQTLADKLNYTVHYITLKLYVHLGMQIRKVHRVLQFKQAKWMKPYIELNTAKRKEAVNKFEESFYKLMNNSSYGKTLESKRNRVNVSLVCSEEEVGGLTTSPFFDSFKIFNENLAAITTKKRTIVWNKPTIVGATVLDLAKFHMYDFHYNVMRKNFNCRLLYSDTDSLLYEIKQKDFYKELLSNPSLRNNFDLSNYPPSHELYNMDQKMVTLKFKDEFGGQILREFIGLKPKMYSILYGDNQKLSAKGVTQFAQRQLKHNLYRQVLTTRESFKTLNTRIGSKHHQLQTIRTEKVSLSCFDDKRYIMDDGITTLPLCHYSIRDLAVFREILEDDSWGEEVSQPSPTWSEFQVQGWVPNNPPRSPSDALIPQEGRVNLDTTYDLLYNCTPPDPGFYQRHYSEDELNQNLADFDQTEEESSPEHNPFIDSEALEDDQEGYSSEHNLFCNNESDENYLVSCQGVEVEIISDEEPNSNHSREVRVSPERREAREYPNSDSSSSDIEVIAEYTEDERNLLSDIENFFEFNSNNEAVGIRPLKRMKLNDLEEDSE